MGNCRLFGSTQLAPWELYAHLENGAVKWLKIMGKEISFQNAWLRLLSFVWMDFPTLRESSYCMTRLYLLEIWQHLTAFQRRLYLWQMMASRCCTKCLNNHKFSQNARKRSLKARNLMTLWCKILPTRPNQWLKSLNYSSRRSFYGPLQTLLQMIQAVSRYSWRSTNS